MEEEAVADLARHPGHLGGAETQHLRAGRQAPLHRAPRDLPGLLLGGRGGDDLEVLTRHAEEDTVPEGPVQRESAAARPD